MDSKAGVPLPNYLMVWLENRVENCTPFRWSKNYPVHDLEGDLAR